jgi:hypothetical protein
MYYVFYDTGNDEFFDRVASAFCSAVLNYIAGHYTSFLPPAGKIVDMPRIKRFFEDNKRMLSPLNCAMLGNCENPQCRSNYRAALTSDQAERFAWLMEDAKTAYFRKINTSETARERLNFQTIFDNYVMVYRDTVEEIPVLGKKSALEYKRAFPNRYKRLYAAKVRQFIKKIMKEKTDVDAFVYVRAEANSDFNYFKRKTGLSNLIPCDFLWQVCGKL